MATFGASPIANTDYLDSPPPQRTGAQSFCVTTAPAHLVVARQVDRVVPCNLHSQFGLAPVDGYAGVEQQLVPAWAGSISPAWTRCPAWTCFTNGSGYLAWAGHISPARTNFGACISDGYSCSC
eukprot:4790646-Amphidinium_carterae.1